MCVDTHTQHVQTDRQTDRQQTDRQIHYIKRALTLSILFLQASNPLPPPVIIAAASALACDTYWMAAGSDTLK